MKEKEIGSLFIMIPGPIMYHPTLSVMAKFLYGELAAKAFRTGFAWAGNDYLCEVMQATDRSVQRYLKELIEQGFIRCEYTRDGDKVKRKIYILITFGLYQNDNFGGDKKDVSLSKTGDKIGGNKNDKIGANNIKHNNTTDNKKVKENIKDIPPAGNPATGSQVPRSRRKPKDEEPKDTPPGSAPPPLTKTLHQPFIHAYHKWYMERNGGVKPQILAKDAKAVKTLIGSMAGAVKGAADVKGEIIQEQDLPDHILKGWTFLLGNWNKLTSFLQQQTDLCQISSNFNNIISIIKNGHGTGKVKPINGTNNTTNAAEYVNNIATIVNQRIAGER